MDAERRLTELEIRYTHQAEQLHALGEVVYQQQRALDRLTARVVELERRLRPMVEELEGSAAAAEKPPHY